MAKLKVGDYVIWKNAHGTQVPRLAQIRYIEMFVGLSPTGVSLMRPVPEIEWGQTTSDFIKVGVQDTTNGRNHWAYGNQISRLEEGAVYATIFPYNIRADGETFELDELVEVVELSIPKKKVTVKSLVTGWTINLNLEDVYLHSARHEDHTELHLSVVRDTILKEEGEPWTT